jgi:hypothetical protein
MKKSIITLVILLLSGPIFGLGIAPVKKKKKSNGYFQKEQLLIGPGLNFGAGAGQFSFTVAPTVAYAHTENFFTGITLSYTFFQSNIDLGTVVGQPTVVKAKGHMFSTSVFARYIIANYLIVNVEPELNRLKYPSDIFYNTQTGKVQIDHQRIVTPAFLVGLGYAQRMGTYSHSFFLANYDLVQNPNSPYFGTLDIRAGVMFSLFN